MPIQPGAFPRLCTKRVKRGCAIALALVVALALSAPPTIAQRRSPAEELVEQERIRTNVQRAFNLYYLDEPDGGVKTDNMNIALERLEALGGPAVPLLQAELERSLQHNFMFCAIALGRIGTPDARLALLQAAEVAAGEENEFALIKTAWVGYSLALMGDVEGVALLSQGRHLAGQLDAHDEISVLEAAALFTAPESLEPVHAGFDRLFDQTTTRAQLRELTSTIAAMKIIGDPASIPRLLKALKSSDDRVRREAADALQPFQTEATTAALVGLLGQDGVPHVRYAAGWSLEQTLPDAALDDVLTLLKDEPDGNVRATLYRTAVRLGGASVLDALRPYLGGRSLEDREGLLRALRMMHTDKTYPIFRAGLNDPATRVLDQAAKGLIESPNPRAIDTLIESVDSPRWIVAFVAVRALARTQVERAAPAMARRLVEVELASIISDPLVREHVYELGNALVALNYHQLLEPLSAVADRQRDGHLKQYLTELETLLAALETNGDEVEPWGAALLSDSEAMRELAARRLAEIGTPEAATVLVATFRRVDMTTGRILLRQIGSVDTPATRALIERILTSESFDDFIRWPLREEAAFAAYRLGGDDMETALTLAWERRGGREGRLMVYLAALTGADAIEPLQRVRISRMNYLKWTRGRELDTLDWIVRELRAGRSVDVLARPPEAVDFRGTSRMPM